MDCERRRSQSHRDATIARSAAHNPSTSRIESEADLYPSRLEKKFTPFLGTKKKECAGRDAGHMLTLCWLASTALRPRVAVTTRWPGVPDPLVERLHTAGYTRPMPIQRAAFPVIANGTNTVLHAETGSGKTLAYLVPLLSRSAPADGISAVIVSPSQELAIQIAAEARLLLPEPSDVLLAIQPVDLRPSCLSGARVLVGTPRALLQVFRGARGAVLGPDAVVLDEVDLLLPPGTVQPSPPTMQSSARAPGRAHRMAARGKARARPTRGRGGPAANPTALAIERRLRAKRPAQLVLEWLRRSRPRGAPKLQLVSCSATVCAETRRGVGWLVGGTETPPALRKTL